MCNIAVIGCGYWGKNLTRNMHALGVLRLVCDADASCEHRVASEYPDVAFCTEPNSVFDDHNIHAVVIATPAVTHFTLAKQAILAGKDVLVEKPLSLEFSEAEHLVALAAERKRILMVGHVLQYHPAVVCLKERIAAGELGRIEYLYSNRLNMGKIRTEENILFSFAPHDVSVMLSLLDEEPVAVSCQGGEYLNTSVADVTLSQFVFASRVRGHIFVSWLHPFKEQRLVVVGSEKMAVFDDNARDKLLLYPHEVQWKNRVPSAVKADAERIAVEESEPLRTECQHFIDCVCQRNQPLTDGHEGLRVLRTLNACQEALDRNRTVELESAKNGEPRHLHPNQEAKPAADAVSKKQRRMNVRLDNYFAHESAHIDDGCEIGDGTKIWHGTHIADRAHIGDRCNLGQNCYVAPEVTIGNNVKIQNNVSVYTGTEIEDDVFLGPSCVLTNVSNPRSQINRHSLYEKTVLRRGATVGANATIVCGVEIGRYAFVAAGAVVTRNVPDYALVMGVPAEQRGWMSRHGHRLPTPDSHGIMKCPESGYRYQETELGILRCLDIAEDRALPRIDSVGQHPYKDFKENMGQMRIKSSTTDV